MDKSDKILAVEYVKQRGFRKAQGYAIKTLEMNPEEYEEIFFEGETLQKAIEDFYRFVVEYWIYEPSEGVKIFEDLWDALEYAEEISDVSFDDFKKVCHCNNKLDIEVPNKLLQRMVCLNCGKPIVC